jgi:hypothetical protein
MASTALLVRLRVPHGLNCGKLSNHLFMNLATQPETPARERGTADDARRRRAVPAHPRREVDGSVATVTAHGDGVLCLRVGGVE